MRSPTVVVGGSVAGVRTVQALRARGYEEDIVLVDQEPGPPYDKPALSKEILTGAAAQPPALADLGDLAVDHRPGLAATGLDLAARRLVTGSGSIPFGRLVIATGSRPRRLPALEGWAGVHYLRTRADAASLREEFTRRPRVDVVGGGFVGGEVASSARVLGLDVTIVEAAPRLLARLMPPEVSDRSTWSTGPPLANRRPSSPGRSPATGPPRRSPRPVTCGLTSTGSESSTSAGGTPPPRRRTARPVTAAACSLCTTTGTSRQAPPRSMRRATCSPSGAA